MGLESVISSWGGGTSNTYVSYTAANSWITSSLIDFASWTSATTSQRCAAIMEAARQIDGKQYIYDRKYSSQQLEFPRGLSSVFGVANGVVDTSTTSELEERMQFDVERACCLQALHLLKMNEYSVHETYTSAGIESVEKTAGPITEKFKYGNSTGSTGAVAGSSQNPLCKSALQYLNNWRTTRKIYRK